MFDFVKNNYRDNIKNELLNNSLLVFEKTIDSEGVILKEIAEYNNLKFILGENYIYINGSLHKYFNNGTHNYNDFNIFNLVEVLNDLTLKFKINPFLSTIHNLEFGVNVILPFDTNMFLNSILSYKGKEYEKETYNGKGYLLRFTFDNYQLKIYNKGFQYGINTNVLRFEIKVKKMEYFKHHKVKLSTLSELLNNTIYSDLKYLLLEACNELLIYDNTIKLKGLPAKEKQVLKNGSNPKYWIELKENDKDKFKYKRKEFRKLVSKYGTQNLQETVYKLIENKCNELTKPNIETDKRITEYLSQFKNKKLPELTTFRSANKEPEITRINSSNKGVIKVDFKRVCVTCGRDITNQRKGSKFCSEKLYGKEVKKCRNENSNPRNNYKNKEIRLYSDLILFDVNEFRIQANY